MDYSQKVYTKKSILLATFLGGPLVAGFLIYKNFKVFGKDDSAQKSLIISIACTMSLFSLIFFIPSSVLDKLPNTLFPFIYTGVIALIINKYQDHLISDHFKNGGIKASNWSAAGYSLIGLVLILCFIIPIAISLPHEGYEKDLKIYDKVILHTSKKLNQDISEKVKNAMKQSEFMDVSQESDLFLNEDNNQYVLKFVLTDFNLLKDSAFLYDFNLVENILNSTANLDKKLEIRFTNPMLTKSLDLPYVSIDALEPVETPKPYEGFKNLQRYQINLIQSIYYDSTMAFSDVKIVAESIRKLKTYFPENQPLDLIFMKKRDYYVTKFFIAPEVWADFPFKDKLKATIEYFRSAGISKEIKIVLINKLDYKEKEI